MPAPSGWWGDLQPERGPPAHAAHHRESREEVGSHCHASRPVANKATKEDGNGVGEQIFFFLSIMISHFSQTIFFQGLEYVYILLIKGIAISNH